jgi:hypothetical protein
MEPSVYGLIIIIIIIILILTGDTRPTGALPPRLPVSVRRSASLAKCSALLKGDGSQGNGLRVRYVCYVGGVVRVTCSLIGIMCASQSYCIATVFRVACCTFNVSVVVGLLTQGVDTASINQSFKQ